MDTGAVSVTQSPFLATMTPDGSTFMQRKASRAGDVPGPGAGLVITGHQRAVAT